MGLCNCQLVPVLTSCVWVMMACAPGDIHFSDAGGEDSTDASADSDMNEPVGPEESVAIFDGGDFSDCSPNWVNLGSCNCTPTQCESCAGSISQTDGCGGGRTVDCSVVAMGCSTLCCGSTCCPDGQWCDGTSCSAQVVYQEDFVSTWAFKKIFSPVDIPLPGSAPADAYIKGIYSTSVIKIDAQYMMFFGISLYCANSTVARDSIGLAQSSNGFDWQFVSYILEPDPSSCTKPRDQWNDPVFTYQVNDPAVYFDPSDPNTILVFYTSVKSNHDNYGHIGLAKFDKQLNLVFRNDYFLLGTEILGGAGYSRPTVYWLDSAGPRLYFDSTWTGINKIGSVLLGNLSQLNDPPVKDENTPGIDIDIPNLDAGKMLLLSGGSWARSRPSAADPWSSSWIFTPLSGQGWDKNAQGSPWLAMSEGCKVRLYMSGTIMNDAMNDYLEINIGMAWPSDDREFHFEACRPCAVMSAPVHTNPPNNSTVPVGEPLNLTWSLSDYGQRPLLQNLCVSSNQTACDLAWVALSPTVTLYTMTPEIRDDYVTWQLSARNACGETKGAQMGIFSIGK